jgi:hydroxypyruvate reductase
VVGAGQGGRNQELAAAAAEALAGFPAPAVVASFGTDGIDGMSDVVVLLAGRPAGRRL